MNGNESDKFLYCTVTDKYSNYVHKLRNSDGTTFNPNNEVSSHDQFDIQNNESNISEDDGLDISGKVYEELCKKLNINYSTLTNAQPNSLSMQNDDFLSSKFSADIMDISHDEHLKLNCFSTPQHNETIRSSKDFFNGIDIDKINWTTSITDNSMNNDILNDQINYNEQLKHNNRNLILDNNGSSRFIEMREFRNSDDTNFNLGNDYFRNDHLLVRGDQLDNKELKKQKASTGIF